jgi:hypothetical protein
MRRRKVTYRRLAERCAALGWDADPNTLQQVAGGFRGISPAKAKIVAEALEYEVSPWAIASYRDSLRERRIRAA